MAGKEHPINNLLVKLREIFLRLSFDEIINPVIINEDDIFLQYGKEAPLILDRVFYIGGLLRQDIGISKEEQERIKNIMPYKKTLRSHMTSAWYLTLSYISKTKPLPIRLFSQGIRFGRDPRQDESHLFESIASSCVVMEEGFDMEKGYELCSLILKELGFKTCEFEKKGITSNYYEQGTDTEVSVSFNKEKIGVANLGFYSKASLDNYGIVYPVFNLEFGVDRLCGILNAENDLRRLIFFQFYTVFSDIEIAKSLRASEAPSYGAQISAIIFRKIQEAKDKIGPCEILCYSGRFLGRDITISAYNWDAGKPLTSYAAFNEVWVNDGEIFGLAKDRALKGSEEVYKNGINTGLVFLKLITDGFVAKMEKAFKDGKTEIDIKFKIVENTSDLNLFIPDEIYDYITSHNKRISINGPLFFGIKAEMDDGI